MAASSDPCVCTGLRGHLDESAKKQQRISNGLFRKRLENQRVRRRVSPVQILAGLQGDAATSSEGKARQKEASKLRGFFEQFFGAPK